MRGVEGVPLLYEAMMAFAEARGFREWREQLVEGSRGRVLDVGCGTGRNLPLFRDGVVAIGLDPRLQLLDVARRRSPAAQLVVGSAEALPFRDAAFDTIVSGLVFCSVPDPLLGLSEVDRVLRPGGTLRMLEHVRSLRPLMARWQDLIQPAWTWISGGCHPNRDTEAAVEQAGFTIESRQRRARRNVRLFTARRGHGDGEDAAPDTVD